ncbi:hypothetical protein Hanom_Chr12g01177781 [Helianthus anomalus]
MNLDMMHTYIYIYNQVSLYNSKGFDQLGPQQLKYITFLNDSSDSCMLLVEATAAGEESFLVWESDRRLALA